MDTEIHTITQEAKLTVRVAGNVRESVAPQFPECKKNPVIFGVLIIIIPLSHYSCCSSASDKFKSVQKLFA